MAVPVNLSLATSGANSETPRVHWQKITLVGVGLLGGSLGQAVRRRGLAGRVSGYVRRAESIRECLDAGAVDEGFTELEPALRDVLSRD